MQIIGLLFANFGYFVASLCTLWCTFTGLNSAVVYQNWQISGMKKNCFFTSSLTHITYNWQLLYFGFVKLITDICWSLIAGRLFEFLSMTAQHETQYGKHEIVIDLILIDISCKNSGLRAGILWNKILTEKMETLCVIFWDFWKEWHRKMSRVSMLIWLFSIV